MSTDKPNNADNLHRYDEQTGKPLDRSYLEKDLPPSLQNAIDELIQGEKDNVTHLDCLYDEVYGSINANMWAYCITSEQANYLRSKYLNYDNESDFEI